MGTVDGRVTVDGGWTRVGGLAGNLEDEVCCGKSVKMLETRLNDRHDGLQQEDGT